MHFYRLSLMFVCVLLCGCQMPPQVQSTWKKTTDPWMGSYQPVSRKAVIESLTPGQTTQVDVYNLFGSPNSLFQLKNVTARIRANDLPQYPVNTAEVWSYHSTDARNTFALDPRPIRHHVVTTTLMFDFQGYLIDTQVDERLR